MLALLPLKQLIPISRLQKCYQNYDYYQYLPERHTEALELSLLWRQHRHPAPIPSCKPAQHQFPYMKAEGKGLRVTDVSVFEHFVTCNFMYNIYDHTA